RRGARRRGGVLAGGRGQGGPARRVRGAARRAAPRRGLTSLRPRVTAGPKLRRLALFVAACLVAAACEPAPSATPPTRPPTSEASAAPTDLLPPTPPSGSLVPAIPFADALRDAIDVDAIKGDLERLEAVTDQHGGTRPEGTESYRAAADFVAGELRSLGYDVRLQDVDLP